MIDILAIRLSRLSLLTTSLMFPPLAARDSNLFADAEASNGGVERAVGAVALEVWFPEKSCRQNSLGWHALQSLLNCG